MAKAEQYDELGQLIIDPEVGGEASTEDSPLQAGSELEPIPEPPIAEEPPVIGGDDSSVTGSTADESHEPQPVAADEPATYTPYVPNEVESPYPVPTDPTSGFRRKLPRFAGSDVQSFYSDDNTSNVGNTGALMEQLLKELGLA